MNVRYRVELSQAERGELTAMLSKGKRAARKLKRAQILLAADAGRGEEEIARTVAVSGSTVYRTKRRFVEGTLERALRADPRPGPERQLTGQEEAMSAPRACRRPPEGRARSEREAVARAGVRDPARGGCAWRADPRPPGDQLGRSRDRQRGGRAGPRCLADNRPGRAGRAAVFDSAEFPAGA